MQSVTLAPFTLDRADWMHTRDTDFMRPQLIFSRSQKVKVCDHGSGAVVLGTAAPPFPLARRLARAWPGGATATHGALRSAEPAPQSATAPGGRLRPWTARRRRTDRSSFLTGAALPGASTAARAHLATPGALLRRLRRVSGQSGPERRYSARAQRPRAPREQNLGSNHAAVPYPKLRSIPRGRSARRRT